MTKDEVLKLALEALESCNWVDDGGYGHAEYDHVSTNKAITAIREALAESEARRKEFSETTKRNMEHVEWYLSTHAPEPVAWRYLTRYPTQNVWTYCGSEPETKPEREPLYTTPPQRKPLTDEMKKQMRESCDSHEMRGAFVDGWLSAEAAHGIWPENSDCYGPDWTDRDGEYLK